MKKSKFIALVFALLSIMLLIFAFSGCALFRSGSSVGGGTVKPSSSVNISTSVTSASPSNSAPVAGNLTVNYSNTIVRINGDVVNFVTAYRFNGGVYQNELLYGHFIIVDGVQYRLYSETVTSEPLGEDIRSLFGGQWYACSAIVSQCNLSGVSGQSVTIYPMISEVVKNENFDIFDQSTFTIIKSYYGDPQVIRIQ